LYFSFAFLAIGLIGLEKYLTKDGLMIYQSGLMVLESVAISIVLSQLTYPSPISTNLNPKVNFSLQCLLCIRLMNQDLAIPLYFLGCFAVIRNIFTILFLRKKGFEFTQNEVSELITCSETSIKRVRVGYEYPAGDQCAVIGTIFMVAGLLYSQGIP
jgi:hypothetical protein